MSGSKLKNIIIIILLCVNSVFAVLLIIDKAEESRQAKQSMQDIVSLMEQNGITLSPETIPEESTLYVLKCGRDLESEGRIARSIIGDSQRTDLGGGLFEYKNEFGSVRFRSNGEFEALVSAQPVSEEGSISERSLRLISEMGLAVDENAAVSTNDTVTFPCTWENTEISGCSISFTYADGALTSVAGLRPTAEPDSRTEDRCAAVSTVLVNFLSHLNSNGYICTRIENMQLCYSMSVSVNGVCTLQPMWLINTDAGKFMINAIDARSVLS